MNKNSFIALISAVIILSSSCWVCAKNISFKSSLVWNIEDGADYKLPEDLAGRTYEISKAVKTDAQIQTIAANWEFKGEVILEISVNNGIDYVLAVNGVPLDYTDSSSGNEIKWRVTLGDESRLIKLEIVYIGHMPHAKRAAKRYVTNKRGKVSCQVRISIRRLSRTKISGCIKRK